MIGLNTYSFALNIGLVKKKKKKWSFLDFVNFLKTNKLNHLEFPIDLFSKIEKKKYEFYLNLLQKNKTKYVIDLEKFSIKKIKHLIKLRKKFKFDIVRVKMSNFFGGNRYKINNFYQVKKKFYKDIIYCDKLKPKFQIVIENHQDLTSLELLKLVKLAKHNKISINWDIGNSLATAETPEFFFNKLKDYIINVHIKNYLIYDTKLGFCLKRIDLNNGVINLKKYIKYFHKRNIHQSIELPAYKIRYCNFKLSKYLKSLSVKKNQATIFRNFLKDKSLKKSKIKIQHYSYKKEIEEFKSSLNYVREIIQ